MRLMVLFLLLSACGIKGPPRPPLDEPTPATGSLVDAPDAGCCGERAR